MQQKDSVGRRAGSAPDRTIWTNSLFCAMIGPEGKNDAEAEQLQEDLGYTMDELERRNQKIIDAILEKEKAVCPGAIALIGI